MRPRYISKVDNVSRECRLHLAEEIALATAFENTPRLHYLSNLAAVVDEQEVADKAAAAAAASGGSNPAPSLRRQVSHSMAYVLQKKTVHYDAREGSGAAPVVHAVRFPGASSVRVVCNPRQSASAAAGRDVVEFFLDAGCTVPTGEDLFVSCSYAPLGPRVMLFLTTVPLPFDGIDEWVGPSLKTKVGFVR